MHLSHKILLKETAEQAEYFSRACGTARRVWNWALATWNSQYEGGEKPNGSKLKKYFNSIKYTSPDWLDEDGNPWLKGIHRDAHSQPFTNLQKAWSKFFSDVKKGAKAHPPRFKKKGKSKDSFYLANDKFSLDGNRIRMPKIGWVLMSESLRFEGRILSASVSRTADRWYVSVQVDVTDGQFYRKRDSHNAIGVDLGIKSAAVFSDGTVVEAPKPLSKCLRRLRVRSRRLSRKVKGSNNRRKSSLRLARLHARIANVRTDFVHKLTTRICRENQTVVIEDLNVRGMSKNERLSRAVSDAGFGMFRQQIGYKCERYGTRLVVADRWYPSSKLCSVCGRKNEALTLKDRVWDCQLCKTHHDRDVNAARNLLRLATETALPVASSSSNGDAATQTVCAVAGKVTPVRYDNGLQDVSGQENNSEHISSLYG